MARIDVWLCSPEGHRILPLADFAQLNYTRAVNDIGKLEIVLPGSFDGQLARPDSLIQVWRDNRLDTETAWLVRGIQRAYNRGIRAVTLSAVSGVELLQRRCVVPFNFFDYGGQTMAADDLIKFHVRNHLAEFADTTRRLPSSLFQVADDQALGATVTYNAQYMNVLSVAQDLAKASSEAGVPLFFDVVYLPDTGMWEFRTYAGARGIDKSSDAGAPQTLSVEHGSIGAEQLDDDYSDEVTVVYAGDRGEGAGRVVQMVEDAARSGRSPYGRREAFVSSSSEDAGERETNARAALQRGRPLRTYVADVISTSSSQYGRDWNFGDVVTAYAYGMQLDCRVDAVNVSIDNMDGGRESVRVRLTNTAAPSSGAPEEPPVAPDGLLDFSDADQSGLLAAIGMA